MKNKEKYANMKRIYENIQDLTVLNAINLINMRFTYQNSNNACMGVDYYPQERDDQSLCVKLLEEPNEEDLEYIKAQFSRGGFDVVIEDVTFGNMYYNIWIPNIKLTINS